MFENKFESHIIYSVKSSIVNMKKQYPSQTGRVDMKSIIFAVFQPNLYYGMSGRRRGASSLGASRPCPCRQLSRRLSQFSFISAHTVASLQSPLASSVTSNGQQRSNTEKAFCEKEAVPRVAQRTPCAHCISTRPLPWKLARSTAAF